VALYVQKYGGTSVASAERIRRVAERVVRTADAGHGVCVVVSAMGDTTDDLLDLAAEISPKPYARELDMLLTAGERISMALLSMAIIDLGHEAISFTGSQAGIVTDTSHGKAKIIEVRLNDGFQTGINWSGLLESGANSITASNIGGGTVLVNESGVSDIAGFTGSLDPVDSGPVSGRVTRNPAIPIDGAVTSAFGGVFSLALNIGDFSSFIELLESQGNVQVLSSPRVATLNNQKAIIKVGVDEFFVTDVSSTNIASGNTTSVNPSVTLTPFFSGVALDVTPQISGDNNVTLHIHPSISDVVDQQKTVTIGTATQEIPLARSTVRETDSIVRAASGQVIVIGGLMQDIINDQNAGTPGFKDVPLLGNLFKHTKKASKKSELVILLKPIVVEDSKTWNADMQNSLEEIQRMNSTMKSRQSAEP